MAVSRALAVALPATTKYVYDDVIVGARGDLLLPLAAAVLGATVLLSATTLLTTLLVTTAAQRTIAALREDLYRRALALPAAWHERTRSGELVPRIMLDPEGVSHLVGTGVIQLVGGMLTAAFGLAVLFFLDWRLTIGVLIVLGAFGGATLTGMRLLHPHFRRRAALFAAASGRAAETLANVRLVRVHGAARAEQRALAAAAAQLRAMTTRSLLGVASLSVLSALAAGAMAVVIMVVGGSRVLRGEMTAGELLWFATTVGVMARPLHAIANGSTQLAQALAGLDRIAELRQLTVEHDDDPAREPVPRLDGAVTFDNVSCGARLVSVAAHIEPGSSVAVVGASGAGKSTLLHLLLGLHAPTAGRLLVDGRDLSALRMGDYRCHVAAVLQEDVLFHGTVRDNIAYARPDAAPAAVRAAARLARAATFIDALPDGYDTRVGERGVTLSAGERQRIALARAILAEPRILVLDEATAHLDADTERLVIDGLAAFMSQRTTIVAAHRPLFAARADLVLMLERGRLVQCGTHDELIGRAGPYRALCERQHRMDYALP